MNNSILINRIKARLEATEQSAQSASLKAGLSRDAIRNIFRGSTKAPNSERLQKLADALGCTALYLLGKVDTPLRSGTYVTINIVGYVGAGGELMVIDDHAKGAGLDTIEAPAGTNENAVAVIVRGESMYPVYQDGTVIVYHDCQNDPTDRLNKVSIVRTTDGRIMLKTLQAGSNAGLYNLISFNSAPLLDVELDWAAKIDWIKPV